MTPRPIPVARNLALFALTAAGLAAAWILPHVAGGGAGALVLGALAFGALTQPLYALLHECMHDIAHPRRGVNDALGFAMAAVLPSSFRLLRFVHLGHHMSNRSRRERIEYYAEGESPAARAVFYYAVLLGLNWLGFVLQNVIFTLVPRRLVRRLRLDTDLGATLPSLADGDLRRIRLEFLVVLALHAALVALTPVTAGQYALYLAANALFYSQLRYIYHYEAGFDVVEGAFDLRAPAWLTRFLLNGTYHLTHHRHPKVPWPYLPELARPEDRVHGFGEKLVAQWRGVLPESSQARRDGRVIRWNGERMF